MDKDKVTAPKGHIIIGIMGSKITETFLFYSIDSFNSFFVELAMNSLVNNDNIKFVCHANMSTLHSTQIFS